MEGGGGSLFYAVFYAVPLVRMPIVLCVKVLTSRVLLLGQSMYILARDHSSIVHFVAYHISVPVSRWYLRGLGSQQAHGISPHCPDCDELTCKRSPHRINVTLAHP